MLTYEFSMNIIVLFAIIATAAYTGYKLRRGQLVKSQLLVTSLEHEMINNHTEILELHKEYVDLKLKLQALENTTQPVLAAIETKGPDQLRSIPLSNKLRSENSSEGLRKETYQLNFNGLLKK